MTDLRSTDRFSDRVADYVLGVQRFAPLASYLTVNISSPNTPGLRDLQKREALDSLLARVVETRDEISLKSPRELDLMAELAGLRLRERWADWEREPFSARSRRHVSIYERLDA